MRARTLTLLVLAAVALTPLAGSAHHGADDVYLQQAGNSGRPGSIISDFGMTATLFNNARFPVCTSGSCVQRPTFPKYLGFGVINAEIDSTSFLRVAMVKGSDDGLRWGEPEPAVLQKPSGDVPFLLGSTATHFDVMYNGTPTASGNAPNYPFSIYYKLAPVATGSSISGIHVADSEDGITWVNDRPLTQDAALPLVGGTGTAFTYGPTDITFQPTASSAANCAGAAGLTPWNCRYVMLYDRYDGSTNRLGIAGSGDGTNFAAYPGPILSPTAATWDQSFVGFGSVRIRVVGGVKQYAMFYAGSNGAGSCAGGQWGCLSLGSATSSDGLNWTKSPGNPMTPRTLPNAIGDAANNDTLLNPEAVDDASGTGHSKVFFTAYPDVAFPRPMYTYLAETGPAPAAGPTVTVASPKPGFRTSSATPVEIYVTDTLGTLIGEDLTTLTMTMDGAPVGGATLEKTTITSYRYVATKISVPGESMRLADGTHTFVVSIADLDGNVTTVTNTFRLDTTAPTTVLGVVPAGPAVGFPTSIGTFHATTSDNAGGIGLARVRATVTNPVGLVKVFESNAPSGFNITKVSAQTWNWNWVAPVLDPHFALPGEYRVTLSGVDLGGAAEKASAANTATLLVV